MLQGPTKSKGGILQHEQRSAGSSTERLPLVASPPYPLVRCVHAMILPHSRTTSRNQVGKLERNKKKPSRRSPARPNRSLDAAPDSRNPTAHTHGARQKQQHHTRTTTRRPHRRPIARDRDRTPAAVARRPARVCYAGRRGAGPAMTRFGQPRRTAPHCIPPTNQVHTALGVAQQPGQAWWLPARRAGCTSRSAAVAGSAWWSLDRPSAPRTHSATPCASLARYCGKGATPYTACQNIKSSQSQSPA